MTNETLIYHGTSRKWWRKSGEKGCALYLSTSREDAENYADEAGSPRDPSILAITTFGELIASGAVLDIDDGCLYLPETATWKESVEICDGFRVTNFKESMKKIFRIEQPTWAHFCES